MEPGRFTTLRRSQLTTLGLFNSIMTDNHLQEGLITSVISLCQSSNSVLSIELRHVTYTILGCKYFFRIQIKKIAKIIFKHDQYHPSMI